MTGGNISQMADELAKATTKFIYPALRLEGFRRAGKRDLIRVEKGVAQRLYFQLDAWGSRDFCVTVCANLIAGNESVTLQPGFRLRCENGADLWLPSRSVDEAERSANLTLAAILATALPYFEKIRTLQGYSALLAEERWGSAHHLNFQQGLTAALLGDIAAARDFLTKAIGLYETDGRDWCAAYIAKSIELSDALAAGSAVGLVGAWEQANEKAHGIR